jgi:cytochrome c oxidase subunit II
VRDLLISVLLVAAPLNGGTGSPPAAEISVDANNFAYTPARIVVQRGDIVRITLRAVDMPHTFVVDEYRIAKRAAIGQTITFEFRADRVGTFTIYCNLTTDDRCKRMKGELVVKP